MKIALVLNDDFSIWHFRRGLVTALVSRGIEVAIVTPDGPYVSKLRALGARHVAVPMYRFIAPLKDLKLCWDLYRVFRTIKPDLVHNMTIKPNVYGAIAARLAGTPIVVGLVSGLGYGFSVDAQRKQRLLRFVVVTLYRLACRLSDRVWFQNADDLSLFVSSRITSQEKTVLIRSGGINVKEYSPENVESGALGRLRTELRIDPSTIVVLMMVARVTWSKGVKEFVEASKIAREWSKCVLFLLVGPLDQESPDAVPEEYLRGKESQGFVWLGFRSDVREIISLADIVTLPSYYREGVPRVLLEAMAMAKPIVTTNSIGCREVVSNGQNGILVPVRDSEALATAIQTLVNDNAQRLDFGKQSRRKVEAEFTEDIVVRKVISDLYGLTT